MAHKFPHHFKIEDIDLKSLIIIGEGKDRIAYKFEDFVIKVCKNGISQNKNEWILWDKKHLSKKSIYLSSILNPCHYVSEDYRYLMADFCEPIYNSANKDIKLVEIYQKYNFLYDYRQEKHWGINFENKSIRLIDYGHPANVLKLLGAEYL